MSNWIAIEINRCRLTDETRNPWADESSRLNGFKGEIETKLVKGEIKIKLVKGEIKTKPVFKGEIKIKLVKKGIEIKSVQRRG